MRTISSLVFVCVALLGVTAGAVAQTPQPDAAAAATKIAATGSGDENLAKQLSNPVP